MAPRACIFVVNPLNTRSEFDSITVHQLFLEHLPSFLYNVLADQQLALCGERLNLSLDEVEVLYLNHYYDG